MPQIPLIIITYRDVFQWVANQRRVEHLPSVRISESDLNELGIADGDRVKFSNAAGSIVVQAKLDQDCRRGFGYMPISLYSNRLVSYDGSRARLPNFKRIEVLAQAYCDETG